MIFSSYTNDFCYNRNIDHFNAYYVLLTIATNATYDWFI